MLSQAQRTAILELSAQGVSIRQTARLLKLSRLTVRKVRQSNSTDVPEIPRSEKGEPYRQQILELLIPCKGNLVRVHEELTAGGATLSYPALTAFCRRQGIGQTAVVAAGQYHFEPGEVGGKRYQVQTASAVLCYSCILFFQLYPAFQRFDCKVFLTDALRYMGGTTDRVMIDNTHVVVLRGTGKEMVPVPEMEAFAERFGFRFVAHEHGDANRSARVERPFSFIENNFLAGRKFSSWEDLNQQARQWCDRVNSSGSVSPASAHGGRGRIRVGAYGSLLGAGLLDRTAVEVRENQRQARDRTGCAPHHHLRPRVSRTKDPGSSLA